MWERNISASDLFFLCFWFTDWASPLNWACPDRADRNFLEERNVGRSDNCYFQGWSGTLPVSHPPPTSFPLSLLPGEPRVRLTLKARCWKLQSPLSALVPEWPHGAGPPANLQGAPQNSYKCLMHSASLGWGLWLQQLVLPQFIETFPALYPQCLQESMTRLLTE